MKGRWLFLPLVLLLSGCGYNRIQELDEQSERMRSNVETELMRRNDLIPNLVATVDQAAQFEKTTQTGVAQARSGVLQARDQLAQAVQGNATTQQLNAANAAVSDQLRMFLNVSVEAYPQLRANENFIRLQDELTETENRIAVARRDYNESVANYNTYIRRFPATITARVIGAERKEPFEAPAAAQQAPRVQFPSATTGQ